MKPQIQILIADNNKIFSDSVAVFLSSVDGIDFTASVVEPQIVPEKLRSSPVDVVLVSADIDDISPLGLIRDIKSEFPSIKVIVLALNCDDESVLRFVETGASGYVLKGASSDELIRTIQDVHQARSSCSPRVASLAFARVSELSQQNKRAGNQTNVLTPRETSILELIATGLGNKEIAQQLNISLFTVKNHVHNILEKLHVKYRREAIIYGYKSGLLKQPWPYRELNRNSTREPATW
jgi:DNA-binding NarL/FixJ family response regulator